MSKREFVIEAPKEARIEHSKKMKHSRERLFVASGLGLISLVAVPFFPPTIGGTSVFMVEALRQSLRFSIEHMKFRNKHGHWKDTFPLANTSK